MCINCMLCYAACPIYGLDPKFIGPAAIALAQRYNLDNRDEGASERMEVLSEHEGIWGCTFVGRVHEGLPQARRSGRRDPALQADRRAGVDEGVLHAEGGVMSRSPRLHAVSSALAAPAGVHVLVARRGGPTSRSSCAKARCMFVAWFVVYLLLLVSAVSHGPGSYARVHRMVERRLGCWR